MSRDPMELVGRAERFDGAHKRGCEGRSWTCTCGDDLTAMNLIAQMAACIREMVKWRPIETAPRDGTEVLLRTRDGLISCSWDWTQNEWGSSWLGITLLPDDPTHWLPLPPAPGAEA